MPGIPWHSLELDDIYAKLNTGENGLQPGEAAGRLEKYGPNALRSGKKASSLILFLSQFNNFLIYLLIAATAISFLIGETLDAAIIGVIVMINAVLGFVQEHNGGTVPTRR